MRLMGKRRIKGFTLVEFLFVAVSMSLLLTALVTITMGGLQAYRKGIGQTDMKMQLRKAMDVIAADLRQAIPVSSGSGFISPTFSSGGTAPTTDLHFYRYRAKATNPETSNPDVNVEIRYQLLSDPANPGYYKLQREQFVSGSTWRETLAENLVVNPSNLTSASHFRWETDSLNTSLANYYLLRIKLTMKRYIGVPTAETLTLDTQVRVRADSNLSAGSNYTYKVTTSTYTGIPSSLINPLNIEDYFLR